MHDNEKLIFKDPEAPPTSEALEQALGESYAAYEALQDSLPCLEIEQEWLWYTPYKAWLAKGQHYWTTPRGARKEKNFYWLYVYEGHFIVAVWFKEKNRAEILETDVCDRIKELIHSADSMGKMPTFPVVLDITAAESLADLFALLDYKKRIEK